MGIPLLDLKAQYRSIRGEIDAAVAGVFESQHFILGPKVQECETAVARYSNARYACGVSSGTDALLISLMAENIGVGDEVITTPYTFFATAGSISRLGAVPVFVDVDPVTFNIDPARIEKRVTAKTRAIIPVHLYGQMADMDPIMEIADRRKLVVIEDAAQAIGGEYRGRRAGSIGHYGCFSFFPSKNLGGAGDGGMVVTQDADRAARLQVLRNHGMQPKYYHSMVGGNFRLDALQAAVIAVKIRHLDAWTSGRQANAERYDRLFAEAGLVGGGRVTLPKVVAGRHVFNQYVIRTPVRDRVIAALKARDIGHEIYYPVPLHLQQCFACLGHREGAFPESERAAKETLALPIYPELTDEQARAVVGCIAEALPR
ncbi:MAG: DegT/DnrJ/EryC1/StrS family aminotransferase [Verrucomicrobiota bacterium]